MRSISISEGRVGGPPAGFTLIELLVGLALAMSLAVAASPLWLSFQSAGVRESDRAVQSLQGRVAVARFERDLRLASADGCPFSVAAPVLEASASQVVFLQRPATGSMPVLVEWEIIDGALMRRWGPCPAARPAVFKHSAFLDSKTMLEGVLAGGALTYEVNGEEAAGPVQGGSLASIEAVTLALEVGGRDGRETAGVATCARVGR